MMDTKKRNDMKYVIEIISYSIVVGLAAIGYLI